MGRDIRGVQAFARAGKGAPIVAVARPTAAAKNFSADGADFGPSLIDGGEVMAEVVEAQPPLLCDSLQSPVAFEGKIVLAQRGECVFTAKVKHAQDAGAVAVIMINNVPGTLWMAGQNSEIRIPALCVTQRIGQQLLAMVRAGNGAITLRLFDALVDDETKSIENVAEFSSKGPTWDGRIKPDVLAPGDPIFTARSDGNVETNACGKSGVYEASGTSFSTPLVAGMAALVRQYFREGWYPSGYKRAPDSIPSPSAALVKAMIIHSSVPLRGVIAGNRLLPLGTPPDFTQGFGRVQLNNVLRFATYPNQSREDGGYALFVDESKRLSTGQEFRYCFQQRFSAGSQLRPLKVTLVWTDPPSTPMASVHLVNDLDLILLVSTAGAPLETFAGNHALSSDKTRLDELNNVEVVSVRLVEPGSRITVIVDGRRVVQAPQPYALVVSGSADHVSCDFAEECMSVNCSAHGSCNSGRCECDDGWTGVLCDIGSQVIRSASHIRVSAMTLAVVASAHAHRLCEHQYSLCALQGTMLLGATGL
jgi:hypothetical protein